MESVWFLREGDERLITETSLVCVLKGQIELWGAKVRAEEAKWFEVTIVPHLQQFACPVSTNKCEVFIDLNDEQRPVETYAKQWIPQGACPLCLGFCSSDENLCHQLADATAAVRVRVLEPAPTLPAPHPLKRKGPKPSGIEPQAATSEALGFAMASHVPAVSHDEAQAELLEVSVSVDEAETVKPVSAKPRPISPSNVLTVPPEWEELAEEVESGIIIAGSIGTGKSTLCQWMANRLLSQPDVEAVGIIDCDLGQPMYGSPGTVSLHVITQPIFRAPGLLPYGTTPQEVLKPEARHGPKILREADGDGRGDETATGGASEQLGDTAIEEAPVDAALGNPAAMGDSAAMEDPAAMGDSAAMSKDPAAMSQDPAAMGAAVVMATPSLEEAAETETAWEPRTVVRSAFLGALSPQGVIEEYVEAIDRLMLAFLRLKSLASSQRPMNELILGMRSPTDRSSEMRFPLIVNCCGWVTGLGWQLVDAIGSITTIPLLAMILPSGVQPSAESNDPLKSLRRFEYNKPPLSNFLSSLNVPGFCPWFTPDGKTRIVEIPSVAKHRTKPVYRKLNRNWAIAIELYPGLYLENPHSLSPLLPEFFTVPRTALSWLKNPMAYTPMQRVSIPLHDIMISLDSPRGVSVPKSVIAARVAQSLCSALAAFETSDRAFLCLGIVEDLSADGKYAVAYLPWQISIEDFLARVGGIRLAEGLTFELPRYPKTASAGPTLALLNLRQSVQRSIDRLGTVLLKSKRKKMKVSAPNRSPKQRRTPAPSKQASTEETRPTSPPATEEKPYVKETKPSPASKALRGVSNRSRLVKSRLGVSRLIGRRNRLPRKAKSTGS